MMVLEQGQDLDDNNTSTHSTNNSIKKTHDGNAFFGISLSRKSALGHDDTITHQTVFDFNEICDRDYEYVESCDDDGWLVGGGEAGYPLSFKFPAKDTAHVELLKIGTLRPDWDGVAEEEIIQVLYSGKVLIPEIEVVPTSMYLDGDGEFVDICLRFEMIPSVPDFNDMNAALPINWSLRFIQNQLLRNFPLLSDCPDFFYVKVAKHVKFRSLSHQTLYLGKCFHKIKQWRRNEGPQSLNNGGWDIDGSYIDGFINEPDETQYHSGIWLFENRHTITHFCPPNFLPPYENDPNKRNIITQCLKKEWDSQSNSFQSVGFKFLQEVNHLKIKRSQAAAQVANTSLAKVDHCQGCPPVCSAMEGCVPS